MRIKKAGDSDSKNGTRNSHNADANTACGGANGSRWDENMKGKFMNINSNLLSLDDTLLLSALLCGVTPESPIIHRFQLFFCANFIVGKDNAEEDFQRCIETEVNRNSSTKCWVRADRAIYELTPFGYNRAKQLFPNISSQLSPANDITKVKYKLSGRYNNEAVLFERRGRRFTAIIGDRLFANNNDACRYLGFDTKDRSAARILYNLASRNKFEAT
ncbi:MAG: hypothetical protein NTV58_08075 [Deltaproteobacteria bacterium]|nr:hypothetical protein [Deltaproteobacteria bacterium]